MGFEFELKATSKDMDLLTELESALNGNASDEGGDVVCGVSCYNIIIDGNKLIANGYTNNYDLESDLKSMFKKRKIRIKVTFKVDDDEYYEEDEEED